MSTGLAYGLQHAGYAPLRTEALLSGPMRVPAQVGGLGDVVTGLAKAALARGHFVTVMLPFYECLPKDQIEGLKHECDIEVPKGYRWDGEIRVGEWRVVWHVDRACGKLQRWGWRD